MAMSQGLSLEAPSKNVARERLKMLLVHDRAEANRSLLEKLKDDLISVVARYAEVEAEKADVRIARVDCQTAILARIPVRSLRRVN